MGMCHLFFFLLSSLLLDPAPAFRDEGPLHAVKVGNPSEEFLDRLILTSKLRVNVATSCSPLKGRHDGFNFFIQKLLRCRAALLDALLSAPFGPLEHGVVEQAFEALQIRIGPLALTFEDAGFSGHTELMLYELPEVVDHVATHLAFSEIVEHPIGLVQRRGRRTGPSHPSLTELVGLLLAKARGTDAVRYISPEYLDVAGFPPLGRSRRGEPQEEQGEEGESLHCREDAVRRFSETFCLDRGSLTS